MKNNPDHPPEPPTRSNPVVILTLGILAASTSSILVRYAQREAPSLVIAAYRLLLATLILLPINAVRHRRLQGVSSRRELWLVLISGTLLAVHFATWISSLEYTSVASSVVLVQTSPLFVALLSPLLLQERPRPQAWTGLLIATIGGVLIAGADVCSAGSIVECIKNQAGANSPVILGDGLALAGGISGAGYLMAGRRLRSRMDLLPYITWVYGTAAAALLVLVGILRLPLGGYRPQTFLLFLLLALFPQLLAHSSYNWALRYLPAALVSISLLGEPIAASLLALLLLSEVPPLPRIIGAALVLSGIILALRNKAAPPWVEA
ncbi:MAG: DMT family transporter [Anaerolineales bacterium]